MNQHSQVTVSSLLLAGGLLATVTAQAAGGFSIDRSQEAQIAPGMSADAVRSILGRPERIEHFSGLSGQTFTYYLRGTPGGTGFDVDFDTQGQVVSVGERDLT